MRHARWICLLIALLATGTWAQQPDKDGVYIVGRDVTAPKLIRATPVVYPIDNGTIGIEGSCTLSLVIGVDGTPSKYRLVHSIGGAFDAAALQSVNQSHFEPGKLHGLHVATWIDVWVPFHADRSASTPEMLPLKHVDHTPVVIYAVDASDPEMGIRAKYQGIVMVSVLVTEEGLPASLHVIRPLGMGLDERALKAVSLYRFKPAIKDSKPVPMRITIGVNLRLY